MGPLMTFQIHSAAAAVGTVVGGIVLFLIVRLYVASLISNAVKDLKDRPVPKFEAP